MKIAFTPNIRKQVIYEYGKRELQASNSIPSSPINSSLDLINVQRQTICLHTDIYTKARTYI